MRKTMRADGAAVHFAVMRFAEPSSVQVANKLIISASVDCRGATQERWHHSAIDCRLKSG